MDAPRKLVWKRKSKVPLKRRPGLLSQEEQDNVRRAIQALRRHHGSLRKVAKLLGMGRPSLERIMAPKGTITAAVALEAARLAGVTMDDVLEGRFPRPVMCHPRDMA